MQGQKFAVSRQWDAYPPVKAGSVRYQGDRVTVPSPLQMMGGGGCPSNGLHRENGATLGNPKTQGVLGRLRTFGPYSGA